MVILFSCKKKDDVTPIQPTTHSSTLKITINDTGALIGAKTQNFVYLFKTIEDYNNFTNVVLSKQCDINGVLTINNLENITYYLGVLNFDTNEHAKGYIKTPVLSPNSETDLSIDLPN